MVHGGCMVHGVMVVAWCMVNMRVHGVMVNMRLHGEAA